MDAVGDFFPVEKVSFKNALNVLNLNECCIAVVCRVG